MIGENLWPEDDAIREMPTLHQGQFDNLKIETETHRVWHSRVDDSVSIEKLIDGRWVTIKRGDA